MAQEDDSFFSRWSRRKAQVRTGEPLPAEPPAPAAAAPVAAVVTPAAVAAPAAPAAPAEVAPEPPPQLTLDDVARLTPESDYAAFVARDVPANVRNAAVKKLFTDPHYNVMDGLDIYIDDYSKPSPLSKAEIAMMVGARFLKLVDDPDAPKPPEAAPARTAAAASEPQGEPIPDSGPTAANPGEPETAAPTPPHDDHADLQLQPDHAPERDSAGRGAG